MKITVLGAGQFRKEEIIHAANFYSKILLGPKLTKNLKLRVVIKSKLDTLGECEPTVKGRNPRSFKITLLQRNPDIISTLGHEMVHVKQYAKNELGTIWEIETSSGVSCQARWQGKNWNPKLREDDYYDSPWEIEAFGREVGLYRRWLEYRNRIFFC